MTQNNLSMKVLFGYFVKLLHYIIFPIIILYILFFMKNFYLDMASLSMIYIICCCWYIINECPITSIEEYLTGDKKTGFDETKYTEILLFGKRHIIFDVVAKESPFLRVNMLTFFAFFSKIFYLVINNKYKFK